MQQEFRNIANMAEKLGSYISCQVTPLDPTNLLTDFITANPGSPLIHAELALCSLIDRDFIVFDRDMNIVLQQNP